MTDLPEVLTRAEDCFIEDVISILESELMIEEIPLVIAAYHRGKCAAVTANAVHVKRSNGSSRHERSSELSTPPHAVAAVSRLPEKH